MNTSDRIVELAELGNCLGLMANRSRPANSHDLAAGLAAAKEMRELTRQILDSAPGSRATNSAPQPAHVAVPAPAPLAPKAETVTAGQLYAKLTYTQRAKLKTQEPKVYAALKAANQAQREELTAKLSQTKSMKDRAAIFAELAKL
jgi:hypothetical protein